LSSKNLSDCQGELKKPFENKNKHIRIKGPKPKRKRTIFAVLGVVFVSSLVSIFIEDNFFFDFLLGISKLDLRNYNSNYKSREKPY